MEESAFAGLDDSLEYVCFDSGKYGSFTKKLTHTMITQIAIGIITKVHGNNSSKDALVDIKFCPPKGAKHQTNTRPDTLYQNISATMSFNLNYKEHNG